MNVMLQVNAIKAKISVLVQTNDCIYEWITCHHLIQFCGFEAFGQTESLSEMQFKMLH